MLKEVGERYVHAKSYRIEAIQQQKGLAWSSMDDDHDGSLGDAFHREGISLGVLIDGSGEVSFYKSRYKI